MLTHNIADAIDKTWHPEKPSIFYVVDRHDGGLVAKYKVSQSAELSISWELILRQTDAFYAFHYINAFDDPDTGDVVIDISVYPDTSVIDRLYLDTLRNPGVLENPWMGQARRYRLTDPTKATVGSLPNQMVRKLMYAKAPGKSKTPVLYAKTDFTLPQSVAVELPTLAPGKHHHTYRYTYGITRKPTCDGPILSDGIIKFDMRAAAEVASASRDALEGKEDEYAKFWRIPDVTPSEPIFAPRPSGTSEDDGVLLSVALDSSAEKGRGQSALIVVDAKTMQEVARAELPNVYPFGFHGVYTPSGVGPRKNAL